MTLPYRRSAQADPCRWPEPDADGRCRYCGWPLTLVRTYEAQAGVVIGHYRHRRPRLPRSSGAQPSTPDPDGSSNPHEGEYNLTLSEVVGPTPSVGTSRPRSNRTPKAQGTYPYQPDGNGAVRQFWSSVDQSGGPEACWPWTRGCDSAGYGQGPFHWTRKAHREAYRLTHPDFDTSLEVCHSCDTPPCCNPRHLFADTHKANLEDASRKGRLGKRPLDWPKVHAIRAAYATGALQGDLAREYGVTQALISNIVRGTRWPESKCPVHAALEAVA